MLDEIADAVLYEGYILWPYRRSARKNQQRWTFGAVYPPAFVQRAQAGDVSSVQAQCLVLGDECLVDVSVEVRCLQLVNRRVARHQPNGELQFVDELVTGVGHERVVAWDEAVERRFTLGLGQSAIGVPGGEARETLAGGVIVRSWEPLSGSVEARLEPVTRDVQRLTAIVRNTSAWSGTNRTAAQRHSFLSAHLVFRVQNGAFVSQTDPPPELASQTAACQNVGLWPVLVGLEGERSTMLASPIILPDYPRIAPESPGLSFDSGEIDQLLILNTLSLTDEEKAEVRATDPKAREILDRAEGLSAGHLRTLHGAIREFSMLRRDVEGDAPMLLRLERPTPRSVIIGGTEIRPGATVRLHPRAGADVFDLALAGRVATVESIEQDYDERIHLAVTLADDPGRDLGVERMPAHRFFFSPEEVELLG